jgi:hypothetical protein
MNTGLKELSEDEFKKLQGQYQVQFGIIMNKQVLLLFEAQKMAHLQELELIQNLYQQQRQENAVQYQKQIEVLNQKISQDRQQHENYTSAIEKAVVAIGKQKGAIITENPEVVVKYNRSKYGIMFGTVCSLILLLSILIAFLYNDYRNDQDEYKKIKAAITRFPQIYKFGVLAQHGTIRLNPDEYTGEYLEFTLPPKGGNSSIGKHYILDKDDNRVLIPLHFSKKALE